MRTELTPVFQELYHAYYMLNKICWGEYLPRCCMTISNRRHHSWACATMLPGVGPMISVNGPLCGAHGDDNFIGVLAHEMTHVWQFANGSRGGHGKDFKREMRRIGLDCDTQQLAINSPLYFTIELFRMRQSNLTAHFLTLKKGDYNRRDQIDFYHVNQNILFQ